VLKVQHGPKYAYSPYAWKYDSAKDGKCQLLQFLIKDEMRDANWSLAKLEKLSSKLLDSSDNRTFRDRKRWGNMNSGEQIHYGSITSPKIDPNKEDPQKTLIDELTAKLADAEEKIAAL